MEFFNKKKFSIHYLDDVEICKKKVLKLHYELPKKAIKQNLKLKKKF